MSFKLVVLFASMAIISCTQYDSRNHEETFDNHGTLQRQNDQRRFQEQTRTEENRQFESYTQNNQDIFENDRRHQDRFDNNHHQQQNFNNRGTFDHRVNQQNPTLFHLQPAVFNVQSSSRQFNIQDDSNYDVAYSVSDMTTGDIKTHQETRRGDEVQGQYTIVDSDGFQRRVNYRANDRDGFDAEVKREPVVGYGFTNNYQGHHNQHNFNTNNQQFNTQTNFGNKFSSNQHDQFHIAQPVQFLAVPKSVATTSVSKTEDGQHNQYTTTTTTN